MSALQKIAFFQNRRDEVPNQLLARELAQTRDKVGIREIAANLSNVNKNVRSDCLKVMYEISYLEPALIADFIDDFLELLHSRDNRMVWGTMIALAAIADIHPEEIWAQIDDVLRITENGTVITQVWGIRVLARVAAIDQKYRERIFPFLIEKLRTCIPRDIPTHAGSILYLLDNNTKGEILSILKARRTEMSPAHLIRLRPVLKLIDRM